MKKHTIKLPALTTALLLGLGLSARAELLPDHLDREARLRVGELVAQLGQDPALKPGQHYTVEQAPQRSPFLGVVLQWDHDAELERLGPAVLGVTPGSPAERMGLMTGDRVQAFNGHSLVGAGADAQGRAQATRRFTETLAGLPGGSPLALDVWRDGRPTQLAGALGERQLPGFRLELEAATGVPGGGDADCGYVSTFANPPETRFLYPAEISKIDERQVFESKQEHRLPPGEYTLKVYEQIGAPELRVRGNDRGYSKQLKVRVEANRIYRIAARFNHKQPYDRDAYWEPVVWKEEERACTP